MKEAINHVEADNQSHCNAAWTMEGGPSNSPFVSSFRRLSGRQAVFTTLVPGVTGSSSSSVLQSSSTISLTYTL